MNIRNTNYKSYLLSPHWKARRARALKLAEYKCNNCASGKKLEVHHLRYTNIGHEPDEDLVVLCSVCHEFERNEINLYMQKKLADMVFPRNSQDWEDYSRAKLIIPQEYDCWQYRDAIKSICNYLVL